MTGTITPDRTAQVGTLVSSQPWYARLFTAPLHSPGTLVSSQPLFTALVLHAIPEASASDLCMQVLRTALPPLPTGAVRDPRSERL